MRKWQRRVEFLERLIGTPDLTIDQVALKALQRMSVGDLERLRGATGRPPASELTDTEIASARQYEAAYLEELRNLSTEDLERLIASSGNDEELLSASSPDSLTPPPPPPELVHRALDSLKVSQLCGPRWPTRRGSPRSRTRRSQINRCLVSVGDV